MCILYCCVISLCIAITRDQPIVLLLHYAAVLINFTYYAQYYPQYYAHVNDLCVGILTVLLEYIHLYKIKYLYGDCSILLEYFSQTLPIEVFACTHVK